MSTPADDNDLDTSVDDTEDSATATLPLEDDLHPAPDHDAEIEDEIEKVAVAEDAPPAANNKQKVGMIPQELIDRPLAWEDLLDEDEKLL